LETEGWAVIDMRPVFEAAEPGSYLPGSTSEAAAGTKGTLHRKFDKALRSLPCYTEDYDGIPVRGGFGALGTADSFHHPLIRKTEELIYHHAMVPLAKASGMPILQKIKDRALKRKKGIKPTKEAWHQDLAPPTKQCGILPEKDDIVFGGWFNPESNSRSAQTFSCIPRTHSKCVGDLRGGFFKTMELTEEQKAAKLSVEVPPGHLLVFNESLVHEVVAIPREMDMIRLFTAFVLRTVAKDYMGRTAELLRSQSVMPLKSGQIPPMYTGRDYPMRIIDLANWANHALRPFMLRERTYRGVRYLIPKQPAPSLEELDLMYPPYTPSEMAMYLPAAVAAL
jgi:hypothetical protein